MKNNKLYQKVRKLEATTKKQKCADCSLMRQYSMQQYQFFSDQTNRFKLLTKTNKITMYNDNIPEITRSVAIIGLYLNV